MILKSAKEPLGHRAKQPPVGLRTCCYKSALMCHLMSGKILTI